MPITIEGLTECQNSLEAMETVLIEVQSIILRKFCDEISTVVKDIVPVDTGALHESVHTELLEATLTRVTMAVVAGHPDVIRGAGYFVSTNRDITPTPTTEYAWIVEDNVHYMENAYQWALANYDRIFEEAIKRLVNSIGG